MEKIVEISFEKIDRKLYLIIYYENGKITKIKVKDKYKNDIFYLVSNIYFDNIGGKK